MKAKAKNSTKTVKAPISDSANLSDAKESKTSNSAPLVKEKEVKAKTVKTKTPVSLVKEKTPKAVKAVDLKNLTGDELFLHTLKEMGEPSLVRDMVKAIRKTKQISISKKRLLAKFYASASHLNRDGIVKRIPVNGSMYSYSLLRWKAKKQKETKTSTKVSLVNWAKTKKKTSIAA